MEEVFVKELNFFIKSFNISDDVSCFVVGFGNLSVISDVFGLKVVDNLLIIRYLFEL